MFMTTFVSVLIMLCYAVPGFLVIRTGLIPKASIPSFAKLLMYVLQPCLTVYAFSRVQYSPQMLKEIGLVFLLALLLMGLILGVFALVARKHFDKDAVRLANLCAAFGNCTFIGLPLVEALMPDYPQAVVFSMAFFMAMSVLGWTAGSTLITRDFKHLKPMKIVMNPATLSLLVAMPMYIFGVTLPGGFGDAVNLMGKMTTPVCMMIVGMRLAAGSPKAVFTDRMQYVAVVVKQLVAPFVAFLLVMALPVSEEFKLTFCVLAACPIAAVVLTFAEMLGCGEDHAANGVLLGTLLSVVTVPTAVTVISMLL